MGWFGFNAGSALAASSLATSAFVATHFAAAAAALGWMLAEWMRRPASPACWAASPGRVAGLVAITPASGFVKPLPALLIGFDRRRRSASSWSTAVKSKFGYDDSLDAFGVHGAGGTMGALLTGVFATKADQRRLEGRSGKVLPSGWVDGKPEQVLNQAVGVPDRLGAGRSWERSSF